MGANECGPMWKDSFQMRQDNVNVYSCCRQATLHMLPWFPIPRQMWILNISRIQQKVGNFFSLTFSRASLVIGWGGVVQDLVAWLALCFQYTATHWARRPSDILICGYIWVMTWYVNRLTRTYKHFLWETTHQSQRSCNSWYTGWNKSLRS